MADFMSQQFGSPSARRRCGAPLGLINMMRGSGTTPQKLMRLRALMQFIAIVVIMATLWMGK